MHYMHAKTTLSDAARHSATPIRSLLTFACILRREKCIVLNLENIRQIIASDRTILFSVPDPADYEGETRWVFPTEVSVSSGSFNSSINSIQEWL